MHGKTNKVPLFGRWDYSNLQFSCGGADPIY
jgi:hypothetical protein